MSGKEVVEQGPHDDGVDIVDDYESCKVHDLVHLTFFSTLVISQHVDTNRVQTENGHEISNKDLNHLRYSVYLPVCAPKNYVLLILDGGNFVESNQ